jgi:hypothetical protein
LEGSQKMNFRTFLSKKIYLSTLVLLAVVATGLYLMSDSHVASAQTSRGGSKGSAKVARPDMLAVALNFGSAEQYTVFGAKGIRGDASGVSGRTATGTDEASLGENGSGLKGRSDLGKALSMINQLPCQDVDAELTGGTFAPGVYCAPSAALAGSMILDAAGDASGSFVFRITGSMKSAESFQMTLANGAKAGNVYFVADSAALGAWGSITGTVIARGTVDVGEGTKVSGRAFSKEGEVILGGSSNVALAPGYIQICKRALNDGIATTAPAPAGFDGYTSSTDLTNDQNSLLNRIFRFSVGGVIYEVPTGQCSQPILVTDANATITELIDGFYTNRPDRAAPGGTWFNRFRLVDVSARVTTGGAAPVLTTDLSTRTTTFPMPTTTQTDPVILTFTNTFAIPAVIEICKYPATLLTNANNGGNTGTPATGQVPVDDQDVSGFFDFTVNTNPGSVYTIPVNVCTGPIQVLVPTVPQEPPGASPAPGTTASATVYVTELGEPGFTLEGANVNPAGYAVPNRTIVSPTSLNGWQTQAVGGASVNFENGPATPPLGTGSAELRVGANGDDFAMLRHPGYAGTRMADLTALSYYTYVDQTGSGGQAPYLSLRVDLDGNLLTLADQDTLYFEPVYQTAVSLCANPQPALALQTWQSWNALTGCWWSANSTGGADPGTGVKQLSVILAAYPNAIIRNDSPSGLGGVRLIAGGGAPDWNNFIGNVDAFSIGVSGNTTTYDFEASGTSSTFLQLGTGMFNTIPCMTVPEGFPIPPGCFFSNPGGGLVAARVFEGSTPANQTVFNFFNRTNPGIIKVCKIAGRGVPVGTRFDFAVWGRQATPGTILPGTDIMRFVRVAAGPASQGGFCQIVTEDPDGDGPLTAGGAPTQFIVGTLARVQETQALDDVPGVENCAFGDFPVGLGCAPGPDSNDGADTTPDSEVRVSRISVNGTVGTNTTGSVTVQGVTLGAAGGNPNPDLFGNGAPDRQVIFRVGRGETVVTFVNRLFVPTSLKLCKVAGVGVPVGTPFTFNITVGTEGGLVPGQTNEPITVAPITIPAGDPGPSGQGNCVMVNGPYESADPNAIPLIGTFDVGSTVSISEDGTSAPSITSTTGTIVACSPINPRCGSLVLGFGAGFNEIVFVNSQGAPVSTGFSLSGRVMSPDGGGLRNAQVILTRQDGTRMAMPTNSLGYYTFEGLAGETYKLNVSSRRYRFDSRNVDLSSSLSNVDFTGIE